MKLFSHVSVYGFSNIYLLGPENGGAALLIDPGTMDVPLLNLIENNNYYIKTVLITHSHKNHVKGLQTLLKIYDASIYSRYPQVSNIDTISLNDQNVIKLNEPNIEIKAIEIPGHSNDSIVYKIGDMLFTGDVLSAGHVGNTSNSYAKGNMLEAIRTKILTLDPHTIIFPGHGPPSLLRSEQLINKTLYDKI